MTKKFTRERGWNFDDRVWERLDFIGTDKQNRFLQDRTLENIVTEYK